MTEYIIFGTIIALLTIYSGYTRYRCTVPLLIFLGVLSLFLIGCRYYIGADWDSYKFFYENGYAEVTITGKLEIGYTIWNKMISFLGFSSGMYFAITAFISLFLIYYSAKLFNVDNICFVFLVYYCLFMASLQFNIVRTGLLGSCFVLSLAYKGINENKKSLIWMIIGCSMHYMGLIFLPVWYFIDRLIPTKKVLLFFAIAIAVFVAGVGRVFNSYFSFLFVLDSRIAGYVNDAEEGYGLSVGLIFNIIFFLFMYFTNQDRYKENKGFRILMNTLLLSLLIAVALSDFSIFVARLGQIFNLSLTMLWPLCIQQVSRSKQGKVPKMVFLCLFLTFYLSLYFIKSVGYGDKESLTSAYPYDFRVKQLYESVQ